MAGNFTINITNNSNNVQDFCLFQQPSDFSGGARTSSNSLASQSLASHAMSASVLRFFIRGQPLACVQEAMSSPQVGAASGGAASYRGIDLAPGNASTTVSVSPLGLTPPVNDQGVQPGAFRIVTPSFSPSTRINIGSAIEVEGRAVLSSFVEGNPNYNVDCKPADRFYVAKGSYGAGAVIDFRSLSSRAAACDFTGRKTTANVTFNADGSWTVEML